MTTVKLRHEYDTNEEAIVLGDVPLTELDDFYNKFKQEKIVYDGDEHSILFRDYVVDSKGEAFFCIGWGTEED